MVIPSQLRVFTIYNVHVHVCATEQLLRGSTGLAKSQVAEHSY